LALIRAALTATGPFAGLSDVADAKDDGQRDKFAHRFNH
jgi:hypothetical protein